MTLRRAWRNFDPVLYAALLALSAFGAVMVYSATINTLGLEDTATRQLIYVLSGAALLLLVASVDYRLLELVQHPFPLLTPVALAAANLALVVGMHAARAREAQQPLALDALRPDLPGLAVGVVLIALIFAADRAWLDPAARDRNPVSARGRVSFAGPARWLAALLVLAAAGGAALLLLRRGAAGAQLLDAYGVPVGLAAVYLADCLSLRFADLLRNSLYLLSLALLGLTLVVGQVSGGAQSWLGAGAIQPSELSKVLLILVLARFLSDRGPDLDRIGTVLTSLLLVALPALLIYLQPDLGTALTLVPVWAAMIWMAGLRLRHLLLLAAAGIAALPLAWFGLQDYMRDRLLLFFDPAGDPDSYFNVHQSLVSIGSGGWFGKGLTHGTQSQLHFLRVRHTDFIFAVTAEELGFAGALLLMALLVLLVWRMLRVAERARDPFGRLIATGVAALVLFQSVVNIGMNLGILPVTGIPLPFVSYGGSSLLTLMVSVGLVESVAMRRKKLEFD